MWHKAFKSVVIHCLYSPTRNNPETNKIVIQLKMPWIFWCDSLQWTYSYKFIYRAVPPNSKQMPVSRLRTGILQVSAQALLWVTVVADPTLGQVCGHRWMSLPLSNLITKIFTTGILSSPAWGERHLRITFPPHSGYFSPLLLPLPHMKNPHLLNSISQHTPIPWQTKTLIYTLPCQTHLMALVKAYPSS